MCREGVWKAVHSNLIRGKGFAGTCTFHNLNHKIKLPATSGHPVCPLQLWKSFITCNDRVITSEFWLVHVTLGTLQPNQADPSVSVFQVLEYTKLTHHRAFAQAVCALPGPPLTLSPLLLPLCKESPTFLFWLSHIYLCLPWEGKGWGRPCPSPWVLPSPNTNPSPCPLDVHSVQI